MRLLDTNADGSQHGVFTRRPGTLTNDFFVNLLDMCGEWSESQPGPAYANGEIATGALEWAATRVDLVFGSNSELRAIAEVFAAWTKVMNLDRYDLAAT
jgi:catalase-peroxidase